MAFVDPFMIFNRRPPGYKIDKNFPALKSGSNYIIKYDYSITTTSPHLSYHYITATSPLRYITICTTACEILAAYVMLLYEAITSYCFMRLFSFVMDMY